MTVNDSLNVFSLFRGIRIILQLQHLKKSKQDRKLTPAILKEKNFVLKGNSNK